MAGNRASFLNSPPSYLRVTRAPDLFGVIKPRAHLNSTVAGTRGTVLVNSLFGKTRGENDEANGFCNVVSIVDDVIRSFDIKEETMSIPNKDEMKGKFKQAKGSVKEQVGRATNDPDLIEESQNDKAEGEIQEGFGTARRKVGDAVKDIGKAIGHK